LALSKLKNALKGKIFAEIPDIQRNVTLLRGTVKPRSIVPGYIVFPDPSFNFCGPRTNPI
jgi:hypothetical protein